MKLFNKRYEELAEEIKSVRASVIDINKEIKGDSPNAFFPWGWESSGLKSRVKRLENQYSNDELLSRIADAERTLKGVMEVLLSLGVVAEQKQPLEPDFIFEEKPMVITGKGGR